MILHCKNCGYLCISVLTGPGANQLRVQWVPGVFLEVYLCISVLTGPGANQPCVQWVPGVFLE